MEINVNILEVSRFDADDILVEVHWKSRVVLKPTLSLATPEVIFINNDNES